MDLPDWKKRLSNEGHRALVVADIKNRNFGDKVIFLSLVDILKSIGFDRIIKLSDKNETDNGVRHVNAFNPLLFVLSLAKSDCVVVGGGGIFQDETSRSNLVYFGLAVLAAKLLFKPVYIVGVGVSELKTASSRLIISFICRAARSIAVRDPDSEYILGRYYSGQIEITPDLALFYTYDRTKVSPEFKRFDGKELCILTLRPQNAGSEAITDKKIEGAFLEELSIQVAKLVSNTSLVPVIIAFDQDKDVAYIKSYLDRYDRINCVFIDRLEPDDYCYLCEKAKYVISMRLHGLILAFGRAKNMAGLEYDAKVRHFLRSVGLESQCLSLDKIKNLSVLLKKSTS
jgi:N-acetylglucosaminyldiphosphoundecaprenol N-acetyl-beta-D-mannosaminyltransferase